MDKETEARKTRSTSIDKNKKSPVKPIEVKPLASSSPSYITINDLRQALKDHGCQQVLEFRDIIKNELMEMKEIIQAQNDKINQLQKVVLEQSQKLFTLERRTIEKNLIIYGLDEDDKVDDTLKDIFKATDTCSTNIDYSMRVGKSVPDATRPRPLKVIMKSVSSKRNALNNAKKLRNFPEFDNVYLNADETFIERKENQRLRNKVKDIKLTSPTSAVFIRKGNVMKDNVIVDSFQPIKHQLNMDLMSNNTTPI